jgi:hypothetical protein
MVVMMKEGSGGAEENGEGEWYSETVLLFWGTLPCDTTASESATLVCSAS